MDHILDAFDIAAKSYPLKALAPEIGKAESTLRNELTQQEGYKFGLITAVMVLQKTVDLRPLDRIEALFNRVAFDVPVPDRNKMAPMVRLAGRLTKEFGEHMGALSVALDDGHITTKEARACLKELSDVVEACLALQAYLEQFIGGDS